MTTQINFNGPKPSYKTPGHEATVDHAQTNFDGGRTTKKGGTSKSRQMNYGDGYAGPAARGAATHFGSKPGTGQRGGY